MWSISASMNFPILDRVTASLLSRGKLCSRSRKLSISLSTKRLLFLKTKKLKKKTTVPSSMAHCLQKRKRTRPSCLTIDSAMWNSLWPQTQSGWALILTYRELSSLRLRKQWREAKEIKLMIIRSSRSEGGQGDTPRMALYLLSNRVTSSISESVLVQMRKKGKNLKHKNKKKIRTNQMRRIMMWQNLCLK